MDVDDILLHYGVKGMRWGKRKASVSSERTTYSKSPKKLSDAELAKRIKRMETEKKYNQLNRKDVSDGKRLVMDVLESTGRNVGKTVLTGGSLLAIKLALDTKFGSDVGRQVTKRLK